MYEIQHPNKRYICTCGERSSCIVTSTSIKLSGHFIFIRCPLQAIFNLWNNASTLRASTKLFNSVMERLIMNYIQFIIFDEIKFYSWLTQSAKPYYPTNYVECTAFAFAFCLNCFTFIVHIEIVFIDVAHYSCGCSCLCFSSWYWIFGRYWNWAQNDVASVKHSKYLVSILSSIVCKCGAHQRSIVRNPEALE